MRRLFICILAAMVTAAGTCAAQTSKTEKPYSPRRLADGHPDLQGTYDLATLTPLERPANATGAFYTKEQARQLETAAAQQLAKGDESLKVDRTAPPKGGDGSTGAAGNVGGYNTGWLDWVERLPSSMEKFGRRS